MKQISNGNGTEHFIELDRIESKRMTAPKVYSITDVRDGTKVIYRPESQADQDMPLGAYSRSILDSTQNPKTDVGLIYTYRELAKTSEVNEAIREIVNEAFSGDGALEAFRPMFKPDTEISAKTQKSINEAFDYVYHNLLDFDTKGDTYFRQWYVDGSIYFHMAVDKREKTIKYLQQLDPVQTRRFKEEFYNDTTGLIDKSKTRYIYFHLPEEQLNNAQVVKNFWGTNRTLIAQKCYRFDDNAIAYADSGLLDSNNNRIVSHLFQVIAPFNNMKMMEEAMMIYRIVRAPERRAFYIDVGSMGTAKAMQYVNDIKNVFNNKTYFDSSTESYVNRKSVHSMVEDYYLPRRDGQRGTQIESIGGAENLGVTKDIEYLKDKFYRALNVPIGRLDAEMQNATLLLGRVTEMQRDEYRFKRFIDGLRKNFIPVIEKILVTELMLRGVLTEEEWKHDIIKDLYWDYTEDNAFTEIKKSEKINAQLELLERAANFVGTYFSKEWVFKNVLNMDDAAIDEMKGQIEDDREEEKELGADGQNQQKYDDPEYPSWGDEDNPSSPSYVNKQPVSVKAKVNKDSDEEESQYIKSKTTIEYK